MKQSVVGNLAADVVDKFLAKRGSGPVKSGGYS
jgi:hypothetical protein